MFYGVVHEGYIFSEKDIKYNVDEFVEGKVKTLFITGQSGSGKSTLGHKYEEELKIPCYELDLVAKNYVYKTDKDLKNCGQDLYDFFHGEGSDFRLLEKPSKGWPFITDECCEKFIRFIIKRNARCIVEGIHLYLLFYDKSISIEEFKNSAVIIKGTSMAKSYYRSVKRDYESDKKEDPNIKITDALNFNYLKEKLSYMLKEEKMIKEMRKKIKELEN